MENCVIFILKLVKQFETHIQMKEENRSKGKAETSCYICTLYVSFTLPSTGYCSVVIKYIICNSLTQHY